MDNVPKRNYDKGERRFKHVGKGPLPHIEFDTGHPKKGIGKCPNTLSQAERERLLNEAIPGPNGDRDVTYAKKLYVVHDGAIYEAQTSDQGHTYHGYPFKGKLSGKLLKSLRQMAEEKACSDSFETWVKKHIELFGATR